VCKKRIFYPSLFASLMVVTLLFIPSVEPSGVHAQEAIPTADHGTCIKCHENLYFLYDTGNWFCIRESPMRCVDCHGGDPSSLKQEVAHANRKAHPIINEDVSKCQECHPAECDERVMEFDQVAGISNVLVAVPYQPRSIVNSEQSQQMQPGEPTDYPGWISVMEIIAPILISGLVLVIHFMHRSRQNKSTNRSHK
jgi:hypothetical protein